MKRFGVLLAALGALIMSTSISSSDLASVHDATSVGGVYNLGLLQHQLMIFVAGLALALSGVVIAFVGTIIGQRPENGNVIAPAADCEGIVRTIGVDPAADKV